MSFCVRSIRIFSKFSCDPYYEPLSWFMIFKCISTQHDLHVQTTLSRASQFIQDRKEVPVNVYPEPDNPYDAKAIAFKCWWMMYGIG